MIVGYMRKPSQPGHMAKLLAIMCKHEGLDLIYLTPENVSAKTGKVNGKMLINKKWLNVEIDLPKFIDINPYFFTNKKYKQIMNYLKDNTILSSDKKIPFPKDELYRFKNDEYISKFLIPTEKIESMESMKSFLEKYGTVVIKPVNSSQGKNILILNKKGSNY